MNREMLPKLKNTWIRFSPGLYQAARRRSLDLQFFVEGASKEGLLLRETGSTMQLQVPADHIHAYFSDFDQRDEQRSRGIAIPSPSIQADEPDDHAPRRQGERIDHLHARRQNL